MKVLLIESHALVRDALRGKLEAAAIVRQVVTIEPAEIARHHASGKAFDVVVLALPEDPGAGWKLLDQVGRTWPGSRVLLLADVAPLNWPSGNLAPAVLGCLPKSVPVAVLGASLQLVASGYQVSFGPFSQRPGMAMTAAQRKGQDHGAPGARPTAPPPNPGNATSSDEAQLLGLTPRQYEILVLLSQGHPAKIIRRRLNVSVATVKCHSSAIYKALGVRGKGEAVHAALQRGARLASASGSHAAQPARQSEPVQPEAKRKAPGFDPDDCPQALTA